MMYGLSTGDRCLICGEYVPEGRQVCPQCEKEAYHINKNQKFSIKEIIADFIDKHIKEKFIIYD